MMNMICEQFYLIIIYTFTGFYEEKSNNQII